MKTIISFYKSQLSKHNSEAKRIYKKMSLFSLLRLAVFGFTGFGIYLTYQNWQVAAIIAVVGIAVFLFLLSRHTDLKTKRELHE